ncbi:hypothetical protein DPSP01_007848 [Paraphaeosphaeria sporulosa]|uniref:Uncharacterized protein n=1 Tax=Paraphaeosphaeria sporulosa TaxID=1460663 RepID=A0A177CII2_9PLEO|nr:uncharacterized protein CC84DRAFT_1163542 [Paraphaeosphaeria sporulosa]OAG07334.1 hypothetical protein CC84DRAFT_1163542 [Paraphaeosphaeria sporulosa]
MSNNRTTSTFSSASYSFSSSTVNGETRSRTEATYSDPSGTKVHRSSQEPGQAAREEKLEYDSAGRRIESTGERGRIEDVTDTEGQAARDREYEERMEDEYAKREGGA